MNDGPRTAPTAAQKCDLSPALVDAALAAYKSASDLEKDCVLSAIDTEAIQVLRQLLADDGRPRATATVASRR